MDLLRVGFLANKYLAAGGSSILEQKVSDYLTNATTLVLSTVYLRYIRKELIDEKGCSSALLVMIIDCGGVERAKLYCQTAHEESH